ncbi:MAG: M23 family metallopeptidase [candidate division WOR-3 bacterium]|nr:M23 family metallopeptidase [candidate division WOR-3 bacterium]
MKKGFSIVFTSTGSSLSRHIFISRRAFLILILFFLVFVIFLIIGFINYGAISYRLIESELLKRRLNAIEKEFAKLEDLKKKLELNEIENQRIKKMLGVDKTPAPVAPVLDSLKAGLDQEKISGGETENLPYLMPVIGQLSKKFDESHKGIDIAATLYAPVVAAGSGRVVSVGVDTLYGNYIVIEHSPNYKTFYGHLHSIFVKHGDVVAGGKIIGTVGSTGKSTSPHLHYEVIFKGQSVDPMAYLPAGIEKKGGL